MLLSCSYNFYNGEEHLIASLKSIRSNVDYITIVYQEESNRGNPISEEAMDVLLTAKSEKLVDKIYLYTPDFSQSAFNNELNKRKIGLTLAKEKKCTHFFSIDADEFYYPRQLESARNYIKKHKIRRTFCHSYMHLKSPRFRCLDTTNICFIHEINKSSMIGSFPCPVPLIDPSRIINTKKRFFSKLFDTTRDDFYLFSPDEIAMYHMNFVRKDNLNSKLTNTSTENKEFLYSLRNNINCWNPGEVFFFPGKGEFEFTKVNNDFNTFDDYNF